MSPRRALLIGDAYTRLSELKAESVDCVVTSPPYYGLRDYGVDGQLGQEPTVDDWVKHLRRVCRQLKRVLAPYGSLWLNLGDSYSTHLRFGAPKKSLLMGPERLVRLLIADGWILRNKVVWAKTNALPSPTRDRLTNSHEFVYLLVKRPSYFFDLDAIREPIVSKRAPSRGTRTPQSALGVLAGGRDGLVAMQRKGLSGHPLGKNPGDVWRLGSSSYRGAHFATFPPELIRRPILAACPPDVCTDCGQPWRRSTRPVEFTGSKAKERPFIPCGCGVATRPGVVLDPFFGTGTVAVVAESYGRDWLGIELNPGYLALAEDRLGHDLEEAS
jgi:site-specific DNA-methyltransferase (adenine-specific)